MSNLNTKGNPTNRADDLVNMHEEVDQHLLKKIEVYLKVMKIPYPIYDSWEALHAAKTNYLAHIKTTYHVCHEMYVNILTNKKEIKTFHYSKNLLNLLGYRPEELQYDIVRGGLPEIIWERDYYAFYAELMRFYGGFEEEASVKYYVRDRFGSLIDAELRLSRINQFGGVKDDFIVLVIVSEFYFNEATLDRVLQRRKDIVNRIIKPSGASGSLRNKDIVREMEYMKYCEEFCDIFYPNSFPNNYRPDNSDKICQIKPLTNLK